MNKSTYQPLSYRAEIGITPKWGEIMKWFFPRLKTKEELDGFLGELHKKFKVEETESLLGHNFRFLKFWATPSGMNITWLVTGKQFYSDAEIQGPILSVGPGLLKNSELDQAFKEEANNLSTERDEVSNYITISPGQIRVRLEHGGEQIISKIPFNDIMNFFVRVEEETGLADYRVKKFPNVFESAFERDQVMYRSSLGMDVPSETRLVENDWLNKVGVQMYKQSVKAHIFEAPYYSVDLSVKFFYPDDLSLRGELADSGWDVR